MLDVYLIDRVVWLKTGPADAYGEPGDTTEEPVQARIDRRTRRVLDFGGEEVYAAGSVLMRQRPGHADRLRFDGRDHAILQVQDRRTFAASHYEVFVA